MAFNIVLVEPEIPQNTGNVARTGAATGARLHLVGPMGFKIDNAKLKRAGIAPAHTTCKILTFLYIYLALVVIKCYPTGS